MKSVQELIATGKVPSSTVAADNLAGYPNGWPIFAELSEQVKYDWNNLPSDRVRTLKSGTEYRTALEAFLLAPAVVQNVPTEGPVVELAASPEEEIVNPPAAAGVEAAVIEAPPVTAPVTATVAIEEETEGTVIEFPFGTIAKVKGGWEARVDNKDGSGVQVYKSKTKDELIGKLMQAQAHASAKIRQQEDDKRRLIEDEPADPLAERRRLTPRKMTADEQFDFAEAMSSGDPIRINKAMAKRDEIILGGSAEEVIGQVTQHQDQLEFETYKNTAKVFIKQNPDVLFSKELGDKMDDILLENKWAYTTRNLNKVLEILKSKDEVQFKVSTPATEEDLPIPTSSREATSAAAVPASPAAAKPAAVAPVSKPTPPQPSAAQTEARLRPGSASTGISPRQASVRAGVAPVQSVGLTAEDYNRMSVSDTRRKYKTDPGFRSAVDKLIAEGKI